jgi:hypothetical protein
MWFKYLGKLFIHNCFLQLLFIILKFYFLFKTKSMVGIQLDYQETKTQQIQNKIHVSSSNPSFFIYSKLITSNIYNFKSRNQNWKHEKFVVSNTNRTLKSYCVFLFNSSSSLNLIMWKKISQTPTYSKTTS